MATLHTIETDIAGMANSTETAIEVGKINANFNAINTEVAEVFTGGNTFTNTTTDNTISVDQNGNVGTDVATDGAVHIENTGNTRIGLGVYSNLDATAAAPLISAHVDNPTFDQNLVNLLNDGVGKGFYLNQTTPAASRVFEVYTDAAHVTSPVCLFKSDNASTTQQLMQLWDDGTATCLRVDKNNSGYAIEITHDDTGNSSSVSIIRNGNTANRIFALDIDIDNAGAGNLVGGINFSNMADGEPLFKFGTLDTDLSTKSPETDAETGWFPVLVGTTVYAVPVYALS